MEARGASAQVVVVWNAMCAAASFENQDVLKALEPYGANVAYDFHGYETFLRYAARHAPCCCDAARPRRGSAAQCPALGRGPLCGVLQHSLARTQASLPPGQRQYRARERLQPTGHSGAAHAALSRMGTVGPVGPRRPNRTGLDQ
jgi:hypothetical protein